MLRRTIRATRSMMDDGWIVSSPDGQRHYYPDTGGEWIMCDDGTVGQQTQGTLDVRAPRGAGAMRRWLLQDAEPGETVEVS